MNTACYEYKCRRCGNIIYGLERPAEDVVGLVTEPPIEHTDCHRGVGVGVGIADCIGFGIDERTAK